MPFLNPIQHKQMAPIPEMHVTLNRLLLTLNPIACHLNSLLVTLQPLHVNLFTCTYDFEINPLQVTLKPLHC